MTDTVEQRRAASTPDERPPGRRPVVLTAAVGTLLVVAAAAFELAYLPLPYPSDQINYFDAARDFPHPSGGTPVHQFTRFGLTLPLRGAIELLGYSEAAYYVVPVLTGLALVVAVYLLGTLLVARSVGVAAAGLMLANNLIFTDLLAPLPDVLATTLFCWAMVVAVAIGQERRVVSSSTRRRVLALLLLGLLLGWSALAREYVVLAWPLAVFVVYPRVRWRGLALVAVPVAVLAVVELALDVLTYGDPLTRLHAVVGHGGGPVPPELAATYQGMSRWWYLTRLPAGLSVVPEGGWLLAALAAAAVGGVLAWRRLGVLLVWLALVYVPLVLLGGVLDPSAPKLRLFMMRYWFPAFPAFVLGGFGAVWLLARLVARRGPGTVARRAGAVAGAVVLVLGALAVGAAAPSWGYSHSYRTVGARPLGEFRAWLAAHHGEVPALWSDIRTVRVLPLYTVETFGQPVWSGPLRTLSSTGPQPTPGEYVVLYGTRGEVPCQHCGDAARAALGDPLRVPASWHRVFATRDAAVLVFRVGGGPSER